MEDIPLMKMDGNECLKLPTNDLGQLLSCDIDELVQQVQELLVGPSHNLLVLSGIEQSDLCIPGPDKLDTQNGNLGGGGRGIREYIGGRKEEEEEEREEEEETIQREREGGGGGMREKGVYRRKEEE